MSANSNGFVFKFNIAKYIKSGKMIKIIFEDKSELSIDIILLSSISGYFKTLMNNTFKENKNKNLVGLELKDVKIEVFQLFLQIISPTNNEEIIHLLSAKKFDELIGMLDRFIIHPEVKKEILSFQRLDLYKLYSTDKYSFIRHLTSPDEVVRYFFRQNLQNYSTYEYTQKLGFDPLLDIINYTFYAEHEFEHEMMVDFKFDLFIDTIGEIINNNAKIKSETSRYVTILINLCNDVKFTKKYLLVEQFYKKIASHIELSTLCDYQIHTHLKKHDAERDKNILERLKNLKK